MKHYPPKYQNIDNSQHSLLENTPFNKMYVNTSTRYKNSNSENSTKIQDNNSSIYYSNIPLTMQNDNLVFKNDLSPLHNQRAHSVTKLPAIHKTFNNNNNQVIDNFLITQIDREKLELKRQLKKHDLKMKNASQVSAALFTLQEHQCIDNIFQSPRSSSNQFFANDQDFSQSNNEEINFENSKLKKHHPSPSMPNLKNKLNRIKAETYWAKLQAERRKNDQKQNIEDIQQNKKYLKYMQDTFYNTPFDKIQREVHGDGVESDYYTNYKTLSKIQQENEVYKLQNSAFTEMNKKGSKHKTLPVKMGLIQNDDYSHIKLKNNKINIAFQRYGDRYATVLGSAFKQVNNINQFQLNGNRISQQGSQKLLPQIVNKAVKLKLKDNRIGELGAQQITLALQNKSCKIQHLDIEYNLLGNNNIKPIIQTLNFNKNLKILNLSKNNLNDGITQSFVQILEENSCSLQELYLHWNNLTVNFGQTFFPLITENDTLKVLDVSNNSLGKQIGQTTCIQEICRFFEQNKEIIHLDLSSNFFNYNDTVQLAKSLEKNHTIYGFHFSGNSGFVNDRQFLIPQEINEDRASLLKKKRIKSCKMVPQQIYRQQRDTQLYDCCWICQGWREVEFTYDPIKGGVDVGKDPLFINFSFENFAPGFMGQKNEDNTYTYKRMVPPGKLQYFFSTIDEEVFEDFEIFSAEDQPKIPNPDKKTFLVEEIPFLEKTFNSKIEHFNHLFIKPDPEIIKYYQAAVDSLPRVPDPYVPPTKKKKKKNGVTLCFEYDWETGKMNKWLKEEEEFVKVKNFFRSKYQFLKDWYKFNACYNPIQDIWAIQNLAFTEFINKINLIDPKISAAQINVKWTAVISSAKGMNTIPASVILNNMKPQEFTYVGFQQDLEKQELHYPHNQKPEDYQEQYRQRDETKPEVIVIPPEMRIERKEGNFLRNLAQFTDPNALIGQKSNRNPPNGLNRYQVMDIIYKLAEEKYIQEYKTTKSISEAIKMLWDEHLKEEMTSYSSQVWRIQRYWNEKCDTVLKGYKKIIDNVYKDYSKKKVKPGQPPFMCLDELQNICIQMGLDELDHWSSSEHLFSFNLSMMTQVDELCSDRIFQMSLVEFYEAIGRLAEKASFLPLEGVPDLENLDNEAQWPLSKRKELPLGYKMEGFIMVMLQRCCSPLFKQNMPKYTKSIFWVDPDESDYDLV